MKIPVYLCLAHGCLCGAAGCLPGAAVAAETNAGSSVRHERPFATEDTLFQISGNLTFVASNFEFLHYTLSTINIPGLAIEILPWGGICTPP